MPDQHQIQRKKSEGTGQNTDGNKNKKTMNCNLCILVGRVTKDPESRALPSGGTVVNFSLATNHIYKTQAGEKKETTQFHNCVIFGKSADTFAQYVTKGQEIMVQGRIDYQQWENKEGVKQNKTQIMVSSFQFGAKPKGSTGPEEGKVYKRPAAKAKEVSMDEIPVVEEGEINVDELFKD